MWEAFLFGSFCLQLTLSMLIFAVVAWAACEYIRVRRRVVNIARRLCSVNRKMDELIDELLEAEGAAGGAAQTESMTVPAPADPAGRAHVVDASARQQHRERLAALAAGGQAKQYLGRAWTVEQIDSLSEDEVEKLYARYEARLGAAMTKTLGQAALQLYAGVASMLLPIPPENRLALAADLEADPFVGHALSSASCELYHRYGMLLAPLTAALTTAKHCQFGYESPRTIDSYGVTVERDNGGREPTGDPDELGNTVAAGGESDSASTGARDC